MLMKFGRKFDKKLLISKLWKINLVLYNYSSVKAIWKFVNCLVRDYGVLFVHKFINVGVAVTVSIKKKLTLLTFATF